MSKEGLGGVYASVDVGAHSFPVRTDRCQTEPAGGVDPCLNCAALGGVVAAGGDLFNQAFEVRVNNPGGFHLVLKVGELDGIIAFLRHLDLGRRLEPDTSAVEKVIVEDSL